jgi:hypothetical protein
MQNLDIRQYFPLQASIKGHLRTVAWMTLLGLLGGTLTACNQIIDAKKVEDAISTGLKEQIGVEVKSVTCPEDRPIKAQDQFTCDVEVDDANFDGLEFVVNVTQEDDEGNISWEAEGLLSLDAIEKQVTDGIAQQLEVEVTTECGPAYKVAKKGERFECKASDSSGVSKTILIEVTDNEGNVNWKLQS